MTDLVTVMGKWRELVGLFQVEQTFRFALTGDGSSADTANVDGKPGWAWVRYDEKQDKASQVVNWRFPGIVQDVPVIIGKQYATDRYFQVLGVNLDMYLDRLATEAINSYVVPKHGESHHGASGSDPAPVDLRNLVFGKVQPTSPVSLSVYAETFNYDANGVFLVWPGGDIDLTASVPAGGGTHQYALVSLNISTGALVATDGEATPIPVATDMPTVPTGHIPLAGVLLEDTDTTIVNSQIYDYRVVLGGVGVPVGTVTADYTVTSGDEYILVDASIDPVTITLPAVSGLTGKKYTIKKIDTTVNTVTVDADGAETIDDDETAVITDPYTSIDLVCDGSEWWVT